MLRPVLVTAPAVALVSLGDIKAHCRIDVTDDDTTLLPALVQAATDHLDGWSGVLGRCLVNQDWRIDLCGWPSNGDIRLPFPDVSTVTLKYYDADNAEQTVSGSLYEVLEDARGSFIRFLDAFTSPSVYDDRSDGVQVTLTAGYGAAASDVPQAICHAAMMLAAHWYENREAVAAGNPAPVPMAVDLLTNPYRRNRL